MRPFALRNSHFARHRNICNRFLSHNKPTILDNIAPKTLPPSSLPNSSSTDAAHKATKSHSRLDRLLKRTPKFMHRHLSSLRSAPITHISAFLILHEITAVVPLLGLAGAFHYYHWLPTYFSEGTWVVAGVEKFGRYFKRKGWISVDNELEAERLAESGNAEEVEKKKGFDSGKWWDRGEGSVRLVVEFATAYAIVKALLIPRLIVSAWGAPWFAKWTVIPMVNGFKRILDKGKAAVKS